MELRQLRYFVRAVELGSISRAAADLAVVPATLSQQISRLEGEMSTILLQRSVSGVEPTAAGAALFREAKLALRHVQQGVQEAQHLRISGRVNIGLTPTVISMIGLEFLRRMTERYNGVHVHLVEGLSGHLLEALNARELDHALLFRYEIGKYWTVKPLLQETIYLFRAAQPGSGGFSEQRSSLELLAGEPLLLAAPVHGLRQTLDTVFANARLRPRILAEIDSLPTLMDAVAAGFGATLQPWAACARYPDRDQLFSWGQLEGVDIMRSGDLCSLPEEELSSSALAARSILEECVRDQVNSGRWLGVQLAEAGRT